MAEQATTGQAQSNSELLTVFEVMEYLRVSRATVQRWCHKGVLPAVKLGKDYRIRRSDLEAWYEARRSRPTT
jgi:excisionase family DNA binding protein